MIEKIGPMYKTGGEIFDILQIVKEKLGVEYRPSKSSLLPGEIYRHKIYAFSWFMSMNGELVYIIKDLDTGNKKEEANKMTKEEALKKIEELKEYVEKCEKKEKEIPMMYRSVLLKAQPSIVCPWMKDENMPLWWKDVTEWMTFNEDDTFLTWGILAYELAQLMYCREYLKVDVKELLEACKYGYPVFKLVYDITECKYVAVNVSRYQAINERDWVWCFTDKEDSEKVRDYMNKYVAHVKRQMF